MVFMSKKHIMGLNEKDILQKSDIKFSDIIGLDEITNELNVIVKTIKDPEFGEALGVEPSKGILLEGPPGVGKTMIAKAIACEAGLPFLSLSGSDFKELFVGNGARKVRQAFKTARENKPCIVFIDEIDAIGASRDNVIEGSNEESNQTINALLKEMDGFTEREGIFVLAATNHPEQLDSAIKRSGRFDREIVIPPPKNWHTRLKMFEHYMKDKPISDDVDLETIAKTTSGFTGADIKTVCNEAGLIALYRGLDVIDHSAIEEAIDKKVFKGNRTKNDEHKEDKNIVAYHEAGHAVMSMLQGLPVARASIVPTTSGVGGAVFREDSDSFFITKDEIVSQILVAYAGRASEQIKFKKVTTGASNDITQATELIKKIVGRYGFDEDISGLLDMNIVDCDNKFVDSRMRELSIKYYNECKSLLQSNYNYVEQLAQILLEEESLTGAQIKEHLGYIKQVG
jgi:cell division protease FtsH